jgi:hypothetical protein
MSRENIKIESNVHEVIERIEKLREEKGLKSKTQFCKEIGFAKSSYNNYSNVPKSGKAITPSIDLLDAIHKRWPTINIHRLVTGEGLEEIIPEEDRLKLEMEATVLKNDARENLQLSEQLMKKYVELQKERDELQIELEEMKKQIN